MSAYSIVISFAGWILVAIVFECLYASVNRFARCRIAKHYLCEGYWFVASLSVFTVLNWLPNVRELFVALIVCGVHCVLTDQFGRIRPAVNQFPLIQEAENPDLKPEKISKSCPIIQRTASVSLAQEARKNESGESDEI